MLDAGPVEYAECGVVVRSVQRDVREEVLRHQKVVIACRTATSGHLQREQFHK